MQPLVHGSNRSMIDTVPAEEEAELWVKDYLESVYTETLAASLGNGAVALILVVGGVLLLRRRRIASPVLQTWACLRILVGGYFAVRMMAVTRDSFDVGFLASLGEENIETGERFASVFSSVMWIGTVASVLWTAALPIFVLSWFNRRRITRESFGMVNVGRR